ncbi:ABC transporter substrate-binding protein [Noviherbaspirillum galbum]|uniref:ABC transporter substrate-binding protein n=1 Tax=Noviherbaspirillum galbum TaxID=2709383 RepID=A0A6B3SSP7_9BURK|nr:ABC transporter substrate-binding protein [Noviherbaspirillum galbum]NEX63684.1 ABC transporter substrate-binding protein [Noviherbaspirillum galbum]
MAVLTACLSFTAAGASEIRIGFVNGITGPISETAKELETLTAGYLEMVNAQGGVHGKRLKLVVRDDGYNPARTATLTEELVEKEKIVGLVNSAGTAPTLSVIKSGVLSRNRVPLVGVFSGADAIRGPGSEEIYHTRPTYGQEIRKIAQLASTLGLKRIAVLYQDDAFGQGILKRLEDSEKEFGLQVMAKVAYKPGTKDFAAQARSVESVSPQAIFLMGVPDSTYQFMKAYDAPAGAAQIYALSFVTPKLLADTAGDAKARGIGISQVVPNPNSATIPLIKEFRTFLNTPYGKGITPSPVTLEGFLNIRLLLDAIRMAGPQPTGEKVLQALSGMQRYSVGGFQVDFADGNRNGSNFIDIAVVGRNARLQY